MIALSLFISLLIMFAFCEFYIFRIFKEWRGREGGVVSVKQQMFLQGHTTLVDLPPPPPLLKNKCLSFLKILYYVSCVKLRLRDIYCNTNIDYAIFFFFLVGCFKVKQNSSSNLHSSSSPVATAKSRHCDEKTTGISSNWRVSQFIVQS